MLLTIPQLYFDSNSFAPDLSIKSRKQPEDTGVRGKIRCRLCQSIISDRQNAITHKGMHIHEGTNPGGHHYHFAIYKHAPGCAEVGQAISEHSWFKGFSWTIVICNSCSEHLGWLFTGKTRFYGLILNKLLEDDS